MGEREGGLAGRAMRFWEALPAKSRPELFFWGRRVQSWPSNQRAVDTEVQQVAHPFVPQPVPQQKAAF